MADNGSLDPTLPPAPVCYALLVSLPDSGDSNIWEGELDWLSIDQETTSGQISFAQDSGIT